MRDANVDHLIRITRDFFPPQRKSRLPGGYMGKILRVDLSRGNLSI